jgi:3D (Asp-Asp-Asp) domain-containing protein
MIKKEELLMKMKWSFTILVLTSIGLFFPSKGEAALGDRTLSEGMVHNDIIELQEYLIAKEEFPYHTATGYYGVITEEAVREYQEEQNLKVDGIAGPQTINKIKVLRSGDMGRPVVKLQRLLKAWNLYNGTSDGIYGSGTKNAVIQFQQQNGLTADGLAGPQTFKKLNQKAAEVDNQIKELTVESTAYTASCNGCSGITKLGIDLKKYPDGKVIAVDPNVIPLGSTVEVEGYGTAIAADIGGGISENEIDVFFATENTALKWGRKNVKVRVIK